MTKKYELTSKTREINFVDMNGKRACATLYRIRALKPIHFSNGGNIKAGKWVVMSKAKKILVKRIILG